MQGQGVLQLQQVREGVLLLTTCSYTGTTSPLLPRCCSKGVCEELSTEQKQALRQAYVRFGVATARATMRGYDTMIQVR